MKKIYIILDTIRKYMVISITIFTVLLALLQIVLRYFTFLSTRPFPWGDELIRLSSVWVIFLGLSIGIRENAHFSVMIIKEKFKGKFQKVYSLIIDILCILTILVILYQGYEYTKISIASSLQNIKLSIAWFYASIPVGMFYSIVEFIYKYRFGNNYKSLIFGEKK